MEWIDSAIVLSVRPLGEGKQIASLLTETSGRWKGLVSTARSSKSSSQIPPIGNWVKARWSARLIEQLGKFQLETYHTPYSSPLASLFPYPMALTALQSACVLTDLCLPEQHPYPFLYESLTGLLESLSQDASVKNSSWFLPYLHFELTLLRELGFGLELMKCAAHPQKLESCTGDLCYVSPKSGGAVCREAGRPYQGKLLALPDPLMKGTLTTLEDFDQALSLTGHFLLRHLLTDKALPASRYRLKELAQKQSNSMPSYAGSTSFGS